LFISKQDEIWLAVLRETLHIWTLKCNWVCLSSHWANHRSSYCYY